MLSDFEHSAYRDINHTDLQRQKNSEFTKMLFDEDCRKDEDCEEIICPACANMLNIVFGSIPLVVKCSKCTEEFFLRDIIND